MGLRFLPPVSKGKLPEDRADTWLCAVPPGVRSTLPFFLRSTAQDRERQGRL